MHVTAGLCARVWQIGPGVFIYSGIASLTSCIITDNVLSATGLQVRAVPPSVHLPSAHQRAMQCSAIRAIDSCVCWQSLAVSTALQHHMRGRGAHVRRGAVHACDGWGVLVCGSKERASSWKLASPRSPAATSLTMQSLHLDKGCVHALPLSTCRAHTNAPCNAQPHPCNRLLCVLAVSSCKHRTPTPHEGAWRAREAGCPACM